MVDVNFLENLDKKTVRRFYSKWSTNASKAIKRYAQEASLKWFNVQWKNKSKEIPFYIRMRPPKSFKGNVWFSSSAVNYVYGKMAHISKKEKVKFPKGFKVKAIYAYGRWFKRKYYNPDVHFIDKSIIEDEVKDGKRYWVSKTSHDKTHNYKKPLVWTKVNDEVLPVVLSEQLSDYLIKDPKVFELIDEAFEQTMEEFS